MVNEIKASSECWILDLGTLKIFPYKLMVIMSSFYAILAYENVHKNSLLSDNGGYLYPCKFLTTKVTQERVLLTSIVSSVS